ncbi:MAG: hypothetical protein ACKV2Q_25140 [Planctomycetaceae bacterium]
MMTKKTSYRLLKAVVAIIILVGTPRWLLCADETVDGPALMQRVRDDIAWVGKLESFHLMARIEERRTPEGLEHALKTIKGDCPNFEPDPQKHTELLPETNMRLELDFDARRMRYLWLHRNASNRELWREVRMWDGRRCAYHVQDFRDATDRVFIKADTALVTDSFWGWFGYLNQQPLTGWWNDDAKQREQRMDVFGTVSDYVLVDRENYHGVDCHVVLETRQWRDRYYVGVKDGRWYGAKTGVISFANLPKFAETHQRLVEEFLGRSLGVNPSNDVWNAVHEELAALSPARRAAWGKQLYSEVGKRFSPCWEFWFSDFRDLGGGRFLPFRETRLAYDHDEEMGEGQKIVVCGQRTLFVRKLTLNQPLDDSLFDEPIAAGATVVDETAKP